MVAFLADAVLDNGLQYIVDNGSRLDICSQQPANYTEATSTYTLGNKTGLTPTGPADHTSGRKVTIPAITDGSVTGTGTASHWGFSKTTATTALLADDVAAGAPTAGTPALAQAHVLAALGIAAGAPAIGVATLAQVHALAAMGIAAGPPELGMPALGAGVVIEPSARRTYAPSARAGHAPGGRAGYAPQGGRTAAPGARQGYRPSGNRSFDA